MAEALEDNSQNLSANDRKEERTSSLSKSAEIKKSASWLFSNRSPSLQQAPEFCSHRIDWGEHAQPTSHHWWPYTCKRSSNSCAFNSCNNDKSFSHLPLIQCATCSVVVHAAHLSKSQAAKSNVDSVIPSCRPSFIDSDSIDHLSTYDQHHWAPARTLSSSCTGCKHKLSRNPRNYSTKRTAKKLAAVEGATTSATENPNLKLSELSNGLVCLWCDRSYHHRCWESVKDNVDQNKCDYGQYGGMVVRPQWLCRIANPSFAFRAQISDSLRGNHSSSTPVIFFINKVSGGQQGEKVYRSLLRLLNPRQVFLLENDATIVEALSIYSSLPNTRVCICGGDGTVAWVFNHLLDAFPLLKNPPASICPLGTGNDMSRALGWGHRYTSRNLLSTLMDTSRAHSRTLDRWKIQIEALDTNEANSSESNATHRRLLSFMGHPKFMRNENHLFYDNHRTPPNTFFFNYISFGLDAAIVLDYQTRRERDPSKFTSPLKNKILCMNESRKYFHDFALGMAWDLSAYLRLLCDGEDLTESVRYCHSLVVLNTRSFGSGTHPWGTTLANYQDNSSLDAISRRSSQTGRFSVDTDDSNQTTNNIDNFVMQDFGDQKIEVLGLNTRHMALIRMGFHGYRIAQCSEVRIELNHSMPVHMDGGPFHLAGSIAVNITHAGQLTVLTKETR